MESIFHLVYQSEASVDISYTDIRDILEVSRRNNSRDGITGLLIYRDGYFLQLLEGDEAKVHLILNKIRADKRNHSLQVLIETTSDQRLFEDWSMAFFDADIPSPATESLLDLFELSTKADSHDKSLILPMLKKFRSYAPALR